MLHKSRLEHTPPLAALPCKGFNGTPTIPPSIDFIVPKVQIFHMLSNSQNVHPRNPVCKEERTHFPGVSGQQPEVATANLKHHVSLCFQCKRPGTFQHSTLWPASVRFMTKTSVSPNPQVHTGDSPACLPYVFSPRCSDAVYLPRRLNSTDLLL